ncbi:uncharacterized protein VDAG_09182 [Verticillium dahliae VdLs.17]|uniref:Uncharacterized protein n=1 Tax=Verticillium dahliae (strain VdLs.17 / ATCC MYA-4575 / FGSC 10137) TaxID=498257 RepID=G2XFQ8_VERDV|nr:uncharacterized protein VDAG_09182 [Verticillium dahliae VdLs.17]EGY18656.1 hypothetical protein VDAG_09182 [Verticillium dahliae VdLs.17]
MDSAQDELKIQAYEDVRSENQALKNAIADILAYSHAATDPVLQSKIHDAVCVAGSGTESSAILGGTSPGPLQGSPSSLPPASTQAIAWQLEHAQHRSPSANAPLSSQGFSSAQTFSSPPVIDLWKSQHPPIQLGGPPGAHLLLHPDPFRCLTATNGLELIMQYMGAAAFTFSGCIFWHIIGKQEALLRAQSKLVAYRQQSERQRHNSFTNSDLRTSEGPTMVLSGLISESGSSRQWIPLIGERLNHYRRKGHEHAAVQASGFYAAGPVHLDVRSPSGVVDLRWLTPLGIEQRLRAAVGNALFATMAAPVIERFEKDHGYYVKSDERHGEQVYLIDKLLDLLADCYVCCPGMGPIWDSHVVDGLFASWFGLVTGDGSGFAC